MSSRLSSDELVTARQIAYDGELATPRLNVGTLEEKVTTLRPRMVEAAKENRTVTYSELTNGFTDLSQVDISPVLGAIGLLEDSQDRPLLPAVVVQSKTGRPGHGYFDLLDAAAQVSEPVPPGSDEAARRWIWGKHLEDVWNYDWTSRSETDLLQANRDALFP